MQNLTKTLTAISLMAPMGAYSVGVGDIKLYSALNQNLNAEISLLLTDNESIDDIRVYLAPPDKFQEVGVAWSAFLAKIKFEPIKKADGSIVIKLSSQEVLKEPFLDLLLKVSWPKGDIYREFTVLVDPPAVYQQKSAPVVVDSSYAATTQTPATIAPQSNYKITKLATQSVVSGVQQYGPTGRQDTLWKIAEKVTTDNNVSVEQMMMGLFNANPEAFINGNVNSLKAGHTLQVPANDVVLKLSQRQARQEFSKHVKIWRANTQSAAATPNPDSVAEGNDVSSAKQLKIIAPTEAEINQNTVLSAAELDETQNLTPADAETTYSQENRELAERLTKLEQQLAKMQQILVLKDQQLANLQNAKNLQPEPSVSNAKVVSGPAQDVKVNNTTQEVKAAPVKVSENSAAKPPVKVQPVVAAKKAVKPSQPSANVESESGSFGLNAVLGGVGIAMLGLVGWVWWRRKSQIEEIETESMFASSSEISLPETDQDLSVAMMEGISAAAYDVGTVGESSFLSEFTPSDFDAFETNQNEVDPISEADVYLAYGRYQQAEELMRQAIEDQPDRDACKLKLLEIFYTNEDMQSYETYAATLVESGKNEDVEFWKKVVEMGSEICPSSTLFTSETNSANAFNTESIESETTINNAVLAEPLAQTEELKESELDFDLASFDVDEGEQSTEDQEITAADDSSEVDVNMTEFSSSSEDNQDLEFNFSEPGEQTSTEKISDNEDLASDDVQLSEDSGKIAEKGQEESLDSEDLGNIESLDFDLATDSIESENLDTEVAFDADNLESIDFSDTSTATAATVSDSSDMEAVNTDIEIDFDLEIPGTDNASTESATEVSDITDMDAFETKIDLAKAYIDMGDESAAKDITQEVLEKGTEKQKQEAQAILEKLQ